MSDDDYPPGGGGVWLVAEYTLSPNDGMLGEARVYADELEALRACNQDSGGGSPRVFWWPFGTPITSAEIVRTGGTPQ